MNRVLAKDRPDCLAKAIWGVSYFANITADFGEARNVMFGDTSLEEALVKRIVVKLLDEDPAVSPTLNTLQVIYDRLIQTLEDLADYKYKFGLERGFYEESA